ncbi:MAG: DEAD/DEAH box helicase [Desulfarculaceae bacterium]|nr:DEAD/DEAH box helicase [Desulfarculaceae bacterium]MCF8072363.1 DEAD/DEAH box helicase [Desulfarculaceae bacterium]MCF8100284.1 DEAD/DEAH box helicase [Desulfarculaceae bacterium]MCF8116143.1 DEAD/DEAH box helicase [Desulfarculaceae bacterium]
MGGKLQRYVASLGRGTHLAGEVVHLEDIPPRPASYGDIDPPLPDGLAGALAAQGIERLFSHQAAALKLVRAGRDVVVATPTASGKSLVYTLPVLERLAADPEGTALFLFPLKALEQDQMGAINHLALSAGLGPVAAIYDGDTPDGQRRKLRQKPPPIIISNPDMLHQAVCAFPSAWDNFLARLKYIVIDEVHAYRGVFGSHVSAVLRRLLRLAARRGSRPGFVLCSATIANPGEHAASLTGREFAPDQVVDFCGAPAAGRSFALVNPGGAASTTASHLVATAVKQGLATICFTKSRIHTELIHTWVTRSHPELRDLVAGYRAGFLPEERRKIEQDLSSGRLAGVITTSALEMGIDIGGLDLCVLVGYPGSQINTWQRGGRVGRAGRDSAVVLVAKPDALDQWLISHPAEFFARPVESAVLDTANPQILSKHLICAAAEEPLDADDEFFHPRQHPEALARASQDGQLLLDAEGTRYFTPRKRPQREMDLRGAGESLAILDHQGKVVGSFDGVRVYKEGYPGAIYLHRGRAYQVKELDLEHRKVRVAPVKADYYTHARSEKETEILEETGRRPVANFLVHQGRLKVTEQVTGYERRRLSGGDLMGVYPLDLPELTFETHGLWIDIEDLVRQALERSGRHFMGSIHALEHAAISMFPLFALCDRDDIGGISIPLHPQTGKAAVFIYDGVPGGVGLAEKGFSIIEELLERVVELLDRCDCEDGCPACVFSPKCGSGNKPLDKAGALHLTRLLLGLEELGQMEVEPEARPMITPPKKQGRDAPLNYGVFDLETQKLAAQVGGWGNTHLMRVSVGVLYDSEADQCIAYEEDQVNRLIKRLNELELVIGFNQVRFDYGVLAGYTGQDLSCLPNLDLLLEVQEALGHRLSLDALAGATLGAAKTADGLQAVDWWNQGEMEKLTVYCRADVELTRDLFLFGQREGYLLYERKGGERLRIPVDWSWRAIRDKLGL